MPNSYTAPIYEGETISLRDFLMRCARGMGIAIMQRDEPLDEPIKRRDDGWSIKYHREGLQEAQNRLVELGAMTIGDARREAIAAYQVALDEYNKALAENQAKRARYFDMLAQVTAWQPDPKVQYVKDAAIKWLNESIEFDCPHPMLYPKKPEAPLSGEDWRQEKINAATWDLNYHQTKLDESIERERDFNEHIDAFLASLPEA